MREHKLQIDCLLYRLTAQKSSGSGLLSTLIGRVLIYFVDAILRALSFAAAMGWEILWALVLGFTLSDMVQAVVTKGEISRLLPDARPRTILIASGLGAASSSCSYAAVALARSIFRKGGNFTAAMAFQFASTNLVLELGIILAVILGWQFTLAEFTGGPIMIALLVLMLNVVMTKRRVQMARTEADRDRQGHMEGHAAMDMSISGEDSILARAMSSEGLTAISHFFVMDWVSVWSDIAIGLFISGALAAWVPHHFWQVLFLVHHPLGTRLIGPLVGPLVAVIPSCAPSVTCRSRRCYGMAASALAVSPPFYSRI